MSAFCSMGTESGSSGSSSSSLSTISDFAVYLATISCSHSSAAFSVAISNRCHVYVGHIIQNLVILNGEF